ncbi:MAG: RnfABCDGE type electron transport complex subunit B [Spirochaetaceae bacterium]|jgi:Na+-translocating ferredoxin:NAD+ oxidoreductase RNF subunit RnfB|nr:RnfABCDGE type electron transport complex subunit B [Spirochaetaceae bacterium]
MLIVITALFALSLAFILGAALGFFREFFAVPEDPLKGQVREALPGANCGACGFPGCDGYAGALAQGTAPINRCSVGGRAVAERLATLLGGDASVSPMVAVLACQGSREHAPLKGDYWGIPTCRGAKLSTGGTKRCSWACLGYGDCLKVCQFGALRMGVDGLPQVDPAACTGCKQCVAECPQQLLQDIPKERPGAIALCSNRNPIKAMVKKTCTTGCIKCGLCVKNCPEQCIILDRGIPLVDYAKCTACGTCAAKCPTKVLTVLPHSA